MDPVHVVFFPILLSCGVLAVLVLTAALIGILVDMRDQNTRPKSPTQSEADASDELPLCADCRAMRRRLSLPTDQGEGRDDRFSAN